MAAIPDAVDARRASRGVIRAVLRVAVLGGLVITGWLLGSGTGQAHEDAVPEIPESQTQSSSLTQVIEISPSDDGSRGLLNAPSGAQSAVAEVTRAVPISNLPLQPAQAPVLAPLLEPVSELAALAPPTAKNAARPRAAAAKPAPAGTGAPSLAAPGSPVADASTPAPVLRAAAGPSAAAPVCRAVHQAADLSANQLAGPMESEASPAAASPASAPGTTTGSCPAGGSGSALITTSAHSVTLSDRWATATLAATQCRLSASASGIPRSAAQRPSTSPD